MCADQSNWDALPDIQGNLQGCLLLAMPSMPDERFRQAVIYICAHGEDGAMGLVANKAHEELEFSDLLSELSLIRDEPQTSKQINIRNADGCIGLFNGGPVEQHRGFVLHSNDYLLEGTMPVGSKIGLTSSLDVLEHIYKGTGPSRAMVAMGYAGWGAGQLEDELSDNGWLVCPCDPELLFSVPLELRYKRCLSSIGLDIGQLSIEVGHA